jgi:hypothetical protein
MDKENIVEPGMVVHTSNPSYSGCKNQVYCGFKPAGQKS